MAKPDFLAKQPGFPAVLCPPAGKDNTVPTPCRPPDVAVGDGIWQTLSP